MRTASRFGGTLYWQTANSSDKYSCLITTVSSNAFISNLISYGCIVKLAKIVKLSRLSFGKDRIHFQASSQLKAQRLRCQLGHVCLPACNNSRTEQTEDLPRSCAVVTRWGSPSEAETHGTPRAISLTGVHRTQKQRLKAKYLRARYVRHAVRKRAFGIPNRSLFVTLTVARSAQIIS